MKVGAVFPQTEIGADPAAIAQFAQQLETAGFDHLMAYDHVLGADISRRPDWPKGFYTHESMFHEPMVLFAYLAGLTKSLEFVTGVIILPQRQTALVAKQAANLDVFSGGRLRMGFGVGWNRVEYEALGASFAERGACLDEQIDYLRQLWTNEASTFQGRFHTLSAAGINPLPRQRPIPIWIGGVSHAAIARAASKADGWLPVLPAAEAKGAIAAFRGRVVAAGRDPDALGIEGLVFAGAAMTGRTQDPAEVAGDCEAWREAGATHVAIDTMNAGLTGAAAHLAFLTEVRARLSR
jgi:probable F420-dependent oxidoreductase